MTATETLLPAANVFGVAREALLYVLEPVLPDRVQPYTPGPPNAWVAPALYIGRRNSYMEGPTLWAAFTVTAVADGASHAAQAMVEAIASGVWAAVTAAGPTMRFEDETATTLDVSPDVTLYAQDITVSVAVGVDGFCPPDPYVALIPPTPITGGP